MGIKGASEAVIVIIVKEVGRFRSKRERERERERLQAVDDVVVKRLRGTELRLRDKERSLR